jgi:hypothetical protein
MIQFDDFDNEEIKAPDALKNMLVAEIQMIRDALTIVNMFMGEPITVGVKYLQEFDNNQLPLS